MASSVPASPLALLTDAVHLRPARSSPPNPEHLPQLPYQQIRGSESPGQCLQGERHMCVQPRSRARLGDSSEKRKTEAASTLPSPSGRASLEYRKWARVAGRPWGLGFPGAGGTHLGPAGPEDPGGGDDHSGVDPQGARLLDLLQHEAGHLAVVLEGVGWGGGAWLSWAWPRPAARTPRSPRDSRPAGEWHSLLACTRSS